MHTTQWSKIAGTNSYRETEKVLCDNFKANSLDSLANSSHNSESLSDESHDSDSGADTKSKNSFQVKCEVYSRDECGSTRSWTKSESSNSETSYEYISSETINNDKKLCGEKRLDLVMSRMETIPEENEPKVSVKEILARFENLKEGKTGKTSRKERTTNGKKEQKLLKTTADKSCNGKSGIKIVGTSEKTRVKAEKVQQEDPTKSEKTHNTNNILCKPMEDNNNSARPESANSSASKSNKDKLKDTDKNNNVQDTNSNNNNKVNNNHCNVNVKESLYTSGLTSSSKSCSIASASASNSAASTSSMGSNGSDSGSNAEIQIKSSSPQRSRSPPIERLEMITNNVQSKSLMQNNFNKESSPSRLLPPIRDDSSRDGARSPSSPLPPTGKFSLMQFALHNFRQLSDMEIHNKMESPSKSKEKRSSNSKAEWTWKQQTDLIKWQGHSLEGPLLRMEDPELTPLSIECFDCILRYCGDLPLTPEMSEVKCVYTVLMHCHKYAQLRDEVYCQLMKQTTSNKSESPESCQRAWRLLSIVAAYFACSDNLLPFLMEYLASAANDRRRICHGTAAVCLTNLRKTQRCGGRKNVPSVEEVTAVSAGRSARRQIYRLPGGAERVVNTRCSTVVADVIQELCNLIGVTNEAEQQEFSLYCIVQGDAFTMPLAADEYILDVTTELHKAAQPFYLIFCRSVWYYPLKHDASPLYTEVLFNQVAPDYLEGLLLRLGNPNLPPSTVRDMALIAALLHRAADLGHSPSIKEVKFLLPKPVLVLREPRPPQWLALVQTSWGQAVGLSVSRAKHKVLQVLSNWPLFGSSFFAVKRVTGDTEHWQEHILALNRGGVHFLDMNSHETLQHWPFAEVISTRKVRSEDGALFLDMKCGNLLQQRVTRLQTEQAHEISRLVRQYINLEQEHSNPTK